MVNNIKIIIILRKESKIGSFFVFLYKKIEKVVKKFGN